MLPASSACLPDCICPASRSDEQPDHNKRPINKTILLWVIIGLTFFIKAKRRFRTVSEPQP
jgi:hypothetical protein